MNNNLIIKKILDIPHDFNAQGNISPYDLLKKSGYFENYENINEKNILKELKKNPKYAEQWFIFSGDQKSGGWYLEEVSKDSYILGYYPNDPNLKSIEFNDKNEACAAFIKRKIEIIRQIK
jgi:hypothetical protein